MGYMLKRLPQPTEEDIALRNERVTLDGNGRKLLFRSYAPILTLLFVGNFMLLVLRDIKEDFLVNILDMSNQSFRPGGYDCYVGHPRDICRFHLLPQQYSGFDVLDGTGHCRLFGHDIRVTEL